MLYGRFPKFHRVFWGPRPWHVELRHRVKKTSTINLFRLETLKLKIRKLKLWKPTVTGRRRDLLRRRPPGHHLDAARRGHEDTCCIRYTYVYIYIYIYVYA